MNSKGHLFISLAKSVIRITGCIWCIATKRISPMAISFAVAESLGIAEELVDKR